MHGLVVEIHQYSLHISSSCNLLVSRAIRICVRLSGARARKGGSGKNTYGVGFCALEECN